MKYLSVTFILTLIFAGYVINTIWTLAEMFLPPKCSRGDRCFSSYLSAHPVQNLVLYTSLNEYPNYPTDSVTKVHVERNLDCRKPATFEVEVDIHWKTRENGTMYMHAVLLDNSRLYNSFSDIQKSDAVHTFPLVVHIQPQAATFNLLHQKVGKETKVLPYSHIYTQIPLGILTDDLKLPARKLPAELYPYMKIINGNMFLPIIQHNVLKSRIKDLQLLNSRTLTIPMKVSVSPISYGSLRLSLHVKLALDQLYALGFSQKDVDDVKGIFADTNLYILSATMLIASIHLLFDFLSFKHDVSFWRGKTSLEGLSARTVLWRAFSQTVIFLHLMEEKTSLLVLIPAGISAVIELWKITKVMHLEITFSNFKPRVSCDRRAAARERTTAEADAEAMRYLAMVLYPLCFVGAVYSLAYESHKSWYSWLLSSLVNGVYAFGFLFMLPQLFVNYRLRSVAALPWRAFMYKAFNTFIDDVFAFIITMPTAHRVACFRDDLVFLVYLYQRWLYPVDPNRTDSADSMHETEGEEPPRKVREKKD